MSVPRNQAPVLNNYGGTLDMLVVPEATYTYGPFCLRRWDG